MGDGWERRIDGLATRYEWWLGGADDDRVHLVDGEVLCEEVEPVERYQGLKIPGVLCGDCMRRGLRTDGGDKVRGGGR